MIRRLVVSILLLGLGFLMVCVSAWDNNGARAQESEEVMLPEGSASAELMMAVENESVAEVGVDYYLAYPGILPDQPLYVLKMVRDRVRLWLTRGAEERVGLMLLYGDKRLGAALVLAEGGKAELAVTTAQKAEKYLESAVEEARLVADEDMWRLLGRASLKHSEVLEQIFDVVGSGEKSGVQQALDNNKLIIERLREQGGITGEMQRQILDEQGMMWGEEMTADEEVEMRQELVPAELER